MEMRVKTVPWPVAPFGLLIEFLRLRVKQAHAAGQEQQTAECDNKKTCVMGILVITLV